MEVNKAASWEDVLSNNFSAETPQQEEQQTQETQAEAGQEAAEPDVEQTENVQQEEVQAEVSEPINQQQEEIQSDSEEDYASEIDSYEQSIEDLDEDKLYELLTLKKTDFSEVSDIDIVSGYIYDEHPNWDEEDVKFELEQKYGSVLFEEKINLEDIDQELDPEGYKEAVKFNKEIDRAQKLLRRDALEKRTELEALQANIQLPTVKSKQSVEDNEAQKSEVQESAHGLSAEEIERLQKQWLESVERDVPSVEEFKFQLGDEEVSYKVTPEEKQQMVEKMKNFNAETYLVDRGWLNADGTPNVKKITEDVYILENSEKMFKSGWTQAKEKAKMDIIGKDIKNIDFTSKGETFDAKAGDPYAFGNFVLGL